MNNRRKLFVFILSAIYTITAYSAKSEYEEEFEEKIFEFRGFVGEGDISYDDHKARYNDLKVSFDKYKRKGGKNIFLIAAANEYMEAGDIWAQFIDYLDKGRQRKRLGLPEDPDENPMMENDKTKVRRIQGKWGNAHVELENYLKQQRSMKSAAPKVSPKK